MNVIFENFSRVLSETEGVTWVVRNYVFPVSDTVRAHRKRGNELSKRCVSNARLTEVDHGGGDASFYQVHLSQ